jgi:hypothetical protein
MTQPKTGNYFYDAPWLPWQDLPPHPANPRLLAHLGGRNWQMSRKTVALRVAMFGLLVLVLFCLFGLVRYLTDRELRIGCVLNRESMKGIKDDELWAAWRAWYYGVRNFAAWSAVIVASTVAGALAVFLWPSRRRT